MVHAPIRVHPHHAHRIVMRPGQQHRVFDGLRKTTDPCYPAIGRLKELAELRGLERGLMRSNRALVAA